MSTFKFLQLADTQFGLFAHISKKSPEERADMVSRGLKVRPIPPMEGFRPEAELFEQAVHAANRVNPAFVVMCGDMVNDINNPDQVDEVLRIAAKLNDGIAIYWVAGNHDAATDTLHPEPKSLATYRAAFGDDYYSFQHQDSSFIVLNSPVMQHPEQVLDEWESEYRFLRQELIAAKARNSSQIILFTHHPLFGQSAREPDSYWNIPLERRMPVLELLRTYGVSAVFAGHWHRNNYAFDGNMQMVTTGSVGFPLGDDPSGYRAVTVFDDLIEHEYRALPGYEPIEHRSDSP